MIRITLPVAALLSSGLLLFSAIVEPAELVPEKMERLAPKEVPVEGEGELKEEQLPEPEQEASREVVLVDALRGIVFLSNPETMVPQAEAPGITLQGLDVPDEADFRARIEPFLNQPLTLNLLDRINREVVHYFREHDRPVVDAFAPQGQEITNGIVQIAVILGKRGEVRVQGNRYFPDELFTSGVSLKTSEAIFRSLLEADLHWLNRNPFRQVNILLERGERFGEADVVLDVKDRFPLRVYGGVEDSGTSLTGKDRWLAGFNWGNVFGLDHQLSYQYTSSFDGKVLQAHTFDYVAPLPWRHTATFFGGYINADPQADAAGFDLQGKSWQISFRYDVPLPDISRIQHDVGFGFDFKRSNNDLLFGVLRVFDTFTNIAQFTVEYNASRSDAWGGTSFGAHLFISPGGITSDNNDVAFNESRAGATADYVYGRLNLGRVTRLPKEFTWAVIFELQDSNRNLLGSEVLGVGGYQTVRGYDEYIAIGDDGITLRNELRTPTYSLLQLLSMTGPRDELQFLWFFDYGIVRSEEPLPGEHSTDLMSTGLGLRYAIAPYLTARLDYGWQLAEAAPNDDRDSRIHFGALLSW